MSLRPKFQNFVKRNWDDIRDSWLEDVPTFPGVGAPPDPGLERLPSLLEIPLPKDHDRFPDVVGLRRQTLWEAIFLFHKCAYTHLAAQRLGGEGMHSWCMFNGYHSAYLGARGMMALLGVALPELKGRQVALDLYPAQPKKKSTRSVVSAPFREFVIVPLPRLDQRDLWEGLQRVLNVCTAGCWDLSLRRELLNLAHESITPPRNRFLYRAGHWPLDDLISDVRPPDLTGFIGTELNPEDPGFLLRLSFIVYRLFEQLLNDLAEQSAVVATQLAGSRCLADSELPELSCYRLFVAQTATQIGASDERSDDF